MEMLEKMDFLPQRQTGDIELEEQGAAGGPAVG
jgi:hypothetical protein